MKNPLFSPGKAGRILDAVHVLFGTAAVILAGFAIADPQKYCSFFPAVFLLAAFINLFTGIFQFIMYSGNRKKSIYGFLYLITGVLLIALFVVSAVSLWGN